MKIKRLLTALFVTLAWVGISSAASILEPSTVFYGKVLGVGDAQPFKVQEGTLVWTIQLSDGSESVFETELYPLNNEEYSYRLDLPHSAVAFELEPSDTGIPLPPVSSTNVLVSAFVDGFAAEFIGPSSEQFTLGQLLRAQSYRLDMILDKKAQDSDGDGLPDWWEDEMGLDKQDAYDATLDVDGDGLVNLDEYKQGLNPNHDDRVPSLLTEHILVYTDNTTGLRLDGFDADTASSNLIYTLTQAPAYGDMVLLNESVDSGFTNVVLEAGSLFTQADVDLGRLIFVQNGDVSVLDSTRIGLTVQDGAEGVQSEELFVQVTFYESEMTNPLRSELGEQRTTAHRTGQMKDMIIWDSASELVDVEIVLADHAQQRQYFIDGRGDDVLSGSASDDIFTSRFGENQFTGQRGADAFIFGAGVSGTNTITDFTATDFDVLNLSDKLGGLRGLVNEHISFTISGDDTYLKVQDLVLLLQNSQITDVDAYDLIADGLIQIGHLSQLPRLGVEVVDAQASENGDNSAIFKLEREGDWSQALRVTIALEGVAVNGVDYSNVPLQIDFAAGEKVVEVSILPFADNELEPEEVVELLILDGADYIVGTDSRAQVHIQDLQSVVGIEVIEGLATLEPVTPGVITVTRNGQLANSLFVRLELGGQAANGSDYAYVSTFVNFLPGQASVPVQILPYAHAVLDGGAEVVDISVKPDAAYALADQASGRITLVNYRDHFAQWQRREFPDSSDSLADFAGADAGGLGIDHLLRYAYGLDPQDPSSAKLPTIVFRDGHMTVDVHRNPQATDVSIVVEVSNDLKTWNSSESSVERITVQEHATSAHIETYEVVPLVETEDAMYVRVRVEQR